MYMYTMAAVNCVVILLTLSASILANNIDQNLIKNLDNLSLQVKDLKANLQELRDEAKIKNEEMKEFTATFKAHMDKFQVVYDAYFANTNTKKKKIEDKTDSSEGIMFDLTKCRPTVQGQDYIGHINVTQAGVACQNWSKQFPHKHFQYHNGFSVAELMAVRNYCRNPDNEERPWCYTMDPETRWDVCDVPMC